LPAASCFQSNALYPNPMSARISTIPKGYL
jgi:hypothetical protein